MFKYYLLLLVLICSRLPVRGQQEVINDSYYNCSWQEFYQIASLYAAIDASQPDYALLDAAIFHATNQAREQEQFPPFRYSEALHRAAALHCNLMIELDFYGHYNSKYKYFYFPLDRVREFDKKIPLIGENIAEYPLLRSNTLYCLEKLQDNSYYFYNCRTKEGLQPYTYLEYAQKVVENWMNSSPHRKNILSPDFQYLGCAARFSKEPYRSRTLPFARSTQNLGGYER